MKLAAVFVIFFLSGRAQFPSVCGVKDLVKPTANDTALYKKAPCLGPRSQQYFTALTKEGLVLRKTIDSAGVLYKSEKTIIPAINSMNFKLGSPEIACDQSESEFKGRIYICWSDKKNGIKNEDVFLIYSDDKGETWTEPILVTFYPNHKMQFDPVIKVDSKTGNVYLLYYDQQNFLSSRLADVYAAVSKNGGLKFDYYKLNYHPVKPMSHSFSIEEPTSKNEMYVEWTEQAKNNKLNSCNAVIEDGMIKNYLQLLSDNRPEMQRTFVFADEIKIDFKINKDMLISAALTLPLEPGFEKTIVKEKKYKAGTHTFLIKTKALGLKKATYVLTLYYNNNNTYSWVTGD
jgi:hypothetical protein